MKITKVMRVANILLLVVVILLVSAVAFGGWPETVEGFVPYINEQYLFIGDKEYPIAKDVKVFAESDNNRARAISLKESGILGVGKIDKAIVSIYKGVVVEIVILEVLQ